MEMPGQKGLELADVMGNHYLFCHQYDSAIEITPSNLTFVSDSYYGRLFLQELCAVGTLGDVLRQLYIYARPYCHQLRVRTDWDVLTLLTQMLGSGELKVWRLRSALLDNASTHIGSDAPMAASASTSSSQSSPAKPVIKPRTPAAETASNEASASVYESVAPPDTGVPNSSSITIDENAKSVNELIDSDLNKYNSLNRLEGDEFKNNVLINYYLNPDMDVLTKDEFLSLVVYTTALYHPINTGLRGLSPVDKAKWSKVAAQADSGLAKLGENQELKYTESVIRGDTFTDELRDELFPLGGIHQDNGFKSSTHNMAKPFNGNTTTVIKSKTGVKIEDLAVIDTEEEVLFRPGTKYRVISRNEIAGHHYIELEEI